MHTHIPVNDTHYLYTVQVSSLIPVGRMRNDTMTTRLSLYLVPFVHLDTLNNYECIQVHKWYVSLFSTICAPGYTHSYLS